MSKESDFGKAQITYYRQFTDLMKTYKITEGEITYSYEEEHENSEEKYEKFIEMENDYISLIIRKIL